MQLADLGRRFREVLFPPPQPPHLLCGAWTAEEREFILMKIHTWVEHHTQGRGIRRLGTQERLYYYACLRVVGNGTAEEMDKNWPKMKFVYGINAVLPSEEGS